MLFFALLILSAFYVGWNIGSNDAGNCIGTSVGSGILSYKRGIVFVAVFALIGAVFQGSHVMKTIGKGIVTVELSDIAMLVALLSSGAFVTFATFLKLPVSTSQAIVGGVAGVGVAMFGFDSGSINGAVIRKIVLSWVLCPILTMILAFVLYYFLLKFLRRTKNHGLWEKVMRAAVVFSAAYVSYSLGANHAGTAMGVICNKYPDSGFILTVLGGVAIAVGALTFSRRVTETISKNITPLDMAGAFVAQFSGGIGVHVFSVIGVPISTSQSIVGAIAGVGLVRGIRTVGGRQIFNIVVGWVAIPVFTALFSFAVYRLLVQLGV